SVFGNLSGAQRHQFDPRVPHDHPGITSTGERALSAAHSSRPPSARRARMTPPSFPHLLQAFFQEWLGGQRNLSRHTVLSYRDTWRLFLRFIASRKAQAVAQLALTDLTESEVLAFL